MGRNWIDEARVTPGGRAWLESLFRRASRGHRGAAISLAAFTYERGIIDKVPMRGLKVLLAKHYRSVRIQESFEAAESPEERARQHEQQGRIFEDLEALQK